MNSKKLSRGFHDVFLQGEKQFPVDVVSHHKGKGKIIRLTCDMDAQVDTPEPPQLLLRLFIYLFISGIMLLKKCYNEWCHFFSFWGFLTLTSEVSPKLTCLREKENRYDEFKTRHRGQL